MSATVRCWGSGMDVTEKVVVVDQGNVWGVGVKVECPQCGRVIGTHEIGPVAPFEYRIRYHTKPRTS